MTYAHEYQQVPAVTLTDLPGMFTMLLDCCLHEPVWLPEAAREVIAWHGDRCLDCESSSIVIVRLSGGDYGLVAVTEDYTGHGCGCNSWTVRSQSLQALCNRLSDNELHHLMHRTGA